MKLKLYLYIKKNKIPAYKFADMIGYRRERLSMIIHEREKCSMMMALAIENATNGEITKEYMMNKEAAHD